MKFIIKQIRYMADGIKGSIKKQAEMIKSQRIENPEILVTRQMFLGAFSKQVEKYYQNVYQCIQDLDFSFLKKMLHRDSTQYLHKIGSIANNLAKNMTLIKCSIQQYRKDYQKKYGQIKLKSKKKKIKQLINISHRQSTKLLQDINKEVRINNIRKITNKFNFGVVNLSLQMPQKNQFKPLFSPEQIKQILQKNKALRHQSFSVQNKEQQWEGRLMKYNLLKTVQVRKHQSQYDPIREERFETRKKSSLPKHVFRLPKLFFK